MKYLLLILCAFIYTNHLSAQQYILSTESSDIKWTGKAAYSAYSLSGILSAKNGYFVTDNDKIIDATLTIDMRSLDAEIKDLKKHLRSEDFFFVRKYPEANFQLKEPVLLKNGEIQLSGIFTVRGISRQEILLMNAKQIGQQWLLEGTLVLDRTQYGIYYNSPNFFKNLKQEAIADEFEVIVKMIFQKETIN